MFSGESKRGRQADEGRGRLLPQTGPLSSGVGANPQTLFGCVARDLNF